jgi:hypothetical protein
MSNEQGAQMPSAGMVELKLDVQVSAWHDQRRTLDRRHLTAAQTSILPAVIIGDDRKITSA